MIESYLIDTTMSEIEERARLLKSVSGRADVGDLAAHIIQECDLVAEHKAAMVGIEEFLPA